MVPRIHCAACNKIVDHVEWWQDIATDRLIIRVQCHGAVDQCAITGSFILEHGDMMLDGGTAFTNQDQQRIKAE